jgi:hypothetical protein
MVNFERALNSAKDPLFLSSSAGPSPYLNYSDLKSMIEAARYRRDRINDFRKAEVTPQQLNYNHYEGEMVQGLAEKELLYEDQERGGNRPRTMSHDERVGGKMEGGVR